MKLNLSSVLMVGLVTAACVPLQPGARSALAQQPQSTELLTGLPVTPGSVRFESAPAPSVQLARRIASQQFSAPSEMLQSVTAALYDVGDGRRLLVATGAPWNGGPTSGIGFYLIQNGNATSIGDVSGSRSDTIPLRITGSRNGFPIFTASIYEPQKYNPRLDMQHQHYATKAVVLTFDPRSNKFVEQRPR